MIDDPLFVLSKFQAAPQNPESADDRGEQVVEVLGYAARQPSQRVELSDVYQLRLQLLPLGNVEQRTGPTTSVGASR
jgi:hypothetical protein